MIAILTATRDEAAPLLAALNAERLTGAPVETYRFDARRNRPAGVLVVTGMGPDRAAEAVRHVVSAFPVRHLLNVGICGSLCERLKPGDLCRVAAATDGDAVLAQRPTDPDLCAVPARWPSLPAARLATVAEPVFGGDRRERLAAAADVVDMEGHAILREAEARAVPTTLLKCVSDAANRSGRDELRRNLQQASAALAACVAEGLDDWPREPRSLARRLADFVKVEHTLFSLPLLFAGAWLGAGGRMPSGRLLLLVALAGLGARTLGMAMNRILDRRLDLLNPRTAGRDLPSGRLTLRQAWAVAAAGLATYVLACLALGPVCLRLSPIPAALLIGYSLLKRFTPLCHFGIGLVLALGPLCAWVAAAGVPSASLSVALLSGFAFCWMSGFDIIYALQDLESDRRTGVHSLPAALGAARAEQVAAALHLLATALACALWLSAGKGTAAALSLLVVAAAFAAAHHPRLPLPTRFFPLSAVAGIAGALVPVLGGCL